MFNKNTHTKKIPKAHVGFKVVLGLSLGMASITAQSFEFGEEVLQVPGTPNVIFPNLSCSNNNRGLMVMAGLNISTVNTVIQGTYVKSVGIRCSPVEDNRRLARPINFGGVTTGARSFDCPINAYLSGITARSGIYVDRIVSIQCTDYDARVRTTTVPVNMGGIRGDQETFVCANPDSNAISLVRSHQGSWLNKLEVFCGSVPSPLPPPVNIESIQAKPTQLSAKAKEIIRKNIAISKNKPQVKQKSTQLSAKGKRALQQNFANINNDKIQEDDKPSR